VIVVDTSVWVDHFNGVHTPQVARLCELLGQQPIAVGDLILAEILQGFSTEADASAALAYLQRFDLVEMAGPKIAVESAANFRRLRRLGVTIRKTMDMLIGTYCLVNDHELLHADRDFELLAEHLGLRTLRA
jgi:predicted nucleic acid-binding protein